MFGERAIFWVGEGFKHCLGVYTCSWITSTFFVPFHSDISFWLNFGVILDFWGPNGLFLGWGKGSKTVLGSTHVVEQLSFSMFSSILIFYFYLILGSFLTFLGRNGLFLGLGKSSNTGLESTHLVEQLSFSMFSSILTFDFYLFWGNFFSLGGPNRLFLGLGKSSNIFYNNPTPKNELVGAKEYLWALKYRLL